MRTNNTERKNFHDKHEKWSYLLTVLDMKVIVKAIVFPVVMYRCERWTIRKAKHWRIDGFGLWCWSRLLRIPWTARRSNQSNLKETNPAYSLEGLMLKLKLQYFGHLMQRANSLEKTLMLGKTEGRRRRSQQRMRWLDGIISSTDMSLSKLWDIVKDREAWHSTVYGVTKSRTWLSNWTTTTDADKNRTCILQIICTWSSANNLTSYLGNNKKYKYLQTKVFASVYLNYQGKRQQKSVHLKHNINIQS